VNDLDPTGRFSDRADAYRRARPGYPGALLDHLAERLGGLEGLRVADLGSGTGILTADLLSRGCRVWAVEPNEAMRAVAEESLGDQPGFVSVDGSAEATSLEPASIDLVTAAQAFHWFDLAATRPELQRILAPSGRIAVVWNDRSSSGSFHQAYEQFLLEWASDYQAVRRTYGVADRLAGFFGSGTLERATFPNHQDLDLDGLRARLLSSSYLPGEGDARSPAMLAAAQRLFADHQEGGAVRIEYDCSLFLGSF
jgi:SAM-dependent methyltransferase